MTPVPIPCSRNAHDQNVLARRPQGNQHGCHSWESETSNLGRVKIRWVVFVRCAQAKANHVCPQGVDKRGLNSKRCAFVEGRGHTKMKIACPRILVIRGACKHTEMEPWRD